MTPHPITRALIAAIAYSHEPMALTDPNQPDDPLIAVNDAFVSVSGFSRAESIGRNCRFMQGPATDRATVARIAAALREPRGCIEWIVNHRRDGEPFWNLLFISPVFDRDGTLLHFIGNQRDITYGTPATLPAFSYGRADMPYTAQAEFHVLLADILDSVDHADTEQADAARGRWLDRLVESARRIDTITTRLTPPPWTMTER